MANGRTKVTSEQVQGFLKGGKRTIKDVASKFNVTPATARKHVLGLTGGGTAIKTGTRSLPEGTRGRSPDLYTVSA